MNNCDPQLIGSIEMVTAGVDRPHQLAAFIVHEDRTARCPVR